MVTFNALEVTDGLGQVKEAVVLLPSLRFTSILTKSDNFRSFVEKTGV